MNVQQKQTWGLRKFSTRLPKVPVLKNIQYIILIPAMLEKSENVINGEEVNEDLGQNGFRRRSGSRRSIRIVDDEPVPGRRRKCC
jgi:hypothetical protein